MKLFCYYNIIANTHCANEPSFARSLEFSLDRIDSGIRKYNGDLKDPSQRPIIRIRNNDIKRVRSRATSATKARPPRFISRIVCPGDECFSFG